MKHKTNLRLILTLLTFGIGLLFLECRRIQNKASLEKATRKVSNEEKNYNFSNTDYIFFESLSKYLFITLE
ncbi:MAG: hypothetical protein JWR18_3871 [Segetibacter sp.]|nr:hypothetical protein [Segetibacter sp.]